MTRARSTQIDLTATTYYHCVSRCVRRAYLCGDDYEHRREWVEKRLLELAGIFCMDIAAYAVMSNHYHVILSVDKNKADNLSDKEVIETWHKLFKGNLLSQSFIRGISLSEAEFLVLQPVIAEWRTRLTSISWFMRVINEEIARKANQEDNCTGRFWEGRFKSQALLDEKALVACMAYVDLNPIRAGMAKTPESSEHTSIKRRVEKAVSAQSPNHKYQQPSDLEPLVGYLRENMPKGLPFRLTDYLDLVDQTGRVIRKNKKGFIDNRLPAILDRLNINSENWLILTQRFEESFRLWAGSEESLQGHKADILPITRMPKSVALLN